MLSRGRITIGLCVLCAMAALPGSSALGGHGRSFDSKVNLSRKDPFDGHVISVYGGCRIDRIVKVFKARPGKPDQVGKTISGFRGEWSIPTHRHGAYFARVQAHPARQGEDATCPRDRSPIRRF
jgi:hypothetical protein